MSRWAAGRKGRGATDICRTAEIDLSDLDNLLPDPNDLLTKGVGNGFRQYPEGVVPEKPSERLRRVSG
ncbi:unnamed protein product [Prorocentrum cordatum]|uniref:Uncharacterized protein n=1 Tax=Prorocentrum cordatum TaxID=2364126 RepID=A0ABN9T4K9_9DINO|nr:unnamed protein product [Polarella glacialis]